LFCTCGLCFYLHYYLIVGIWYTKVGRFTDTHWVEEIIVETKHGSWVFSIVFTVITITTKILTVTDPGIQIKTLSVYIGIGKINSNEFYYRPRRKNTYIPKKNGFKIPNLKFKIITYCIVMFFILFFFLTWILRNFCETWLICNVLLT